MVVCNTMKPEETKTLWFKQLENMEHQEKLYWGDGELLTRRVIPIESNKRTLESEKQKFLKLMSEFVDRTILEQPDNEGRPKSDLRDIIKSLLVMSFNGMSYRRAESDLRELYEKGFVLSKVPRSTLNDYANKEEIIKVLERLIQYSATFFIENESTIILDSTWFGLRMYSGGYRKVYDKKSASLQKVRKLHISCMKNSKVICFAKATKGTLHDSLMFEEMVKTPIKNGFIISRLLADAGYNARKNYALCKELNILNAFIDFKKNCSTKRAKSDLWRERVRMWKEHKELWKETYRFRVIIEGIFSSIKKKNLNWIRAKKENAQDVELLLKCLVYNLTIIGRYS